MPSSRFTNPAGVLLTLTLSIVSAAHAQIDYRNLDDDRPTRVEDAYPIERFAFEGLLPYQVDKEAGGVVTHSIVPELSYGIARNAQLGVTLPLALEDGAGDTRGGLVGLLLFALYNFNTESRGLPALSLRVDAGFPVGALAGDQTRVGLKGIATRSFGKNRVHLNGAYGVGSGGAAPATEAIPHWWAGIALDRTLFRQSTLLVGEIYALQEDKGAATQVNASIGIRYQWTPTTVIDFGVGRRLRSGVGPDIAVTLGFSHAFAIAGLMPHSGTR